jgi:hypothetical protein
MLPVNRYRVCRPTIQVLSAAKRYAHTGHGSNSDVNQGSDRGSVDWSTKALVSLAATCAISYAWYQWNEYYSSRGLVHPITALITRNLFIEAEDRERRIASMEIHETKTRRRIEESQRPVLSIKEH